MQFEQKIVTCSPSRVMRDKLTLEIPANEGRIVATVFASHRCKGVEMAGSKINNGPISIIPLNKKMLNKTKINYYVKDREIQM
jgi:hypothetical protein